MKTITRDLAENWGMLGNDWAVDMLSNQVRQQETRHAYLLTGPAGIGRRTLALRFIQAMTCPSPVSPASPCGICKACKQIEAMQYPDLAVIQSEKVGKELVVNQVRSIQYNLSLKPLAGKHRFALFLRFHEANASASNALLKTLEEAPSHAVLLLSADSTEKLLPTIVSRCEVLRLKPVPVADIEAALKRLGAEDTQAALLANLSAGRTGVALRLLNDDVSLSRRKEFLDDLRSLLSATRVQKFALADKLTKDKDKDKVRERLWSMFEIWLSYWRDVLVAAAGSHVELVNSDRVEEILALASRLGLPAARQMIARVEAAIGQLDANVNMRLLTEVLFLDLPSQT